MRPTKAIIPVAGYGTRRLPITKSIEKSMLPLLNRPIVDYIVQQCIVVGVVDIYFVISQGSSQLKSYYEKNQTLENYLIEQGKTKQLDTIQPPAGVQFHYIEQDQTDKAYGTAVPVWLCRDIVEKDETVLIVMGDQYLHREDNGSDIADLIKHVESQKSDAGMIVVPIADNLVNHYGIVAVDEQGNFSNIIEKPSPANAPSNLNNASIYLATRTFWGFVDSEMKHERTGEYVITDVLNSFVEAGHTIAVSQAKGKYLDCGTLEGWVDANNYLFELQSN